MQKKKDNNNGIFIICLLVVVTILVLFFPKIYNLINNLSMPEVENIKNDNNEVIDNKIDESILETIHYPVMRTSVYNSNTYYSLDKFTIDNLSNNDILLNAYLDIYEGNMTSYEAVGACTNISKQFDEKYLELRIKNILGNKVNYINENFYVPEDLNSKYIGNWTYDSYNRRYIYTGLCSSNASNIKYYDLEQLIKMEYTKNNIDVYYYVGFAKVEGNNYIIYKDAQMNTELSRGTFINKDELNSSFENINAKNKKIYKYTFKNNLCSYNEYCLYEGKWVNEL